jgi:uncharacterized protein (TIGR04141 family)
LSIGRSIQATDALTVNGTKSFNDVFEFLLHVDALLASASKQIDIPQAAQIDRKSNGPLLDALESQLVQTLHDYSPDTTINLFLDNEGIGYLPDRVTQYELLYNHKTYQAETFDGVFEHVSGALRQINAPADRLSAYRKMHLRAAFDDGMYDTRTLAYFVCGDIVYDNDVYFINNNLWYRASERFLATLDAEIDNVVEFIDASDLGLAEWDEAKHRGKDAETKFNNANKGFHVLHPRLIKVQQQKGGIEFCDLLGAGNGTARLVHVKHGCGAQLRALFAQGAVPARLYAESEEFRKAVHEADLSPNGSGLSSDARAALKSLASRKRREFVVVYAIFDDTGSHTVSSGATSPSLVLNGTLTTFAKVDLLERARSLRGMSYGIAVTRIKPYPRPKGAK